MMLIHKEVRVHETIFKNIANKDEFEKFSVIDGTIEWQYGADLSNDTFYINGTNVEADLLEM